MWQKNKFGQHIHLAFYKHSSFRPLTQAVLTPFMTDTIERFSNRVANYVKYRPDYPPEIITHLVKHCGLTRESVIADVGCGPGMSTRMFLEPGNLVFGVEPNDAMRAAAEEYLAEFPRFKPVKGTSDNTTLPDASIDLIAAAQAFHWFDPDKTRPEFKRIAKPVCWTVLIWNIRQEETTPFLIEYEEFIQQHSVDYHVVRHNNITDKEIGEFLGPDFKTAEFKNIQRFDLEGLLGRITSSSYMPPEGHESFAPMAEALATLFAKHKQNGRIEILYDTKLYYALT
jgi:SAM-dependent methyltransferase